MKHTEKKAHKKNYLINNPECEFPASNVQLLRIILTDSETKIDFGYQTKPYFVNGGWIKINPKTFIRASVPKFKKVYFPDAVNNTSRAVFLLENSINIPFGPEKHYFKSNIEWKYFSLIFPPLPDDIDYIDIIEKEPGSPNDFNFFGINLKEKSKISKLL